MLIQPAPGKYEGPIYVHIEDAKAKRIFYAFTPAADDLETWISRSSAPLPVRSHAGLLNDDGSLCLLGGAIGNQISNRHDRYSERTQSWQSGTPLPLPIKSPGTQKKLLSCGNNTQATMALHKNSWVYKCPAPQKISEHNLVHKENFFIINGKSNDKVYRYDENKDTWSTAANNDYASSYAVAFAAEKIYFTNRKYIMSFNPSTNSFAYEMALDTKMGATSACEHNDHFLLVGGHGEKIEDTVVRIDLKKKTALSQAPLPEPGAYMASGSHSNIGGLSRKNSFYEYKCPFNFEEYKNPILLAKNGKHFLCVVSVDDKYKIINKSVHEFEVNLKLIRFTLRLSTDYLSTVEWPAYLKSDGSSFTISDFLSEDLCLEISKDNGPMRSYSLELLKRYPSLNYVLCANSIYKFKVKDQKSKNIKINIDANVL